MSGKDEGDSSSSSASSSSPSSSSSPPNIPYSSSFPYIRTCGMLVSQLISLNKVATTGLCEFCGTSVHLHNQSIMTPFAASTTLSSSSTSFKLDKNVINDLPKWKKLYKLCTPFFNALDILFTIHNVTDESHFKKYLQLSLSDLPEFEKTYAHTHITSNTSLSWSRVKVLFAQRFESHDHINQLKRQYRALKYTHDDNIQSFSHRFINLCGELNYDVDSSIVIDNFMSLLPSDLHRRFLMQCHGRQKSLSSF
jgi:hypothetical protein